MTFAERQPRLGVDQGAESFGLGWQRNIHVAREDRKAAFGKPCRRKKREGSLENSKA